MTAQMRTARSNGKGWSRSLAHRWPDAAQDDSVEAKADAKPKAKAAGLKDPALRLNLSLLGLPTQERWNL